MPPTDEAREHCRFVGKGIEKNIADGELRNVDLQGKE